MSGLETTKKGEAHPPGWVRQKLSHIRYSKNCLTRVRDQEKAWVGVQVEGTKRLKVPVRRQVSDTAQIGVRSRARSPRNG